MKKMKFILVAVFMLTFSVFAQDKTPEQWATQRTDSLQKALTLTSEQYPKVYAAELDFATKLEILKKSDASKMDKFQQIKTLDEKRDADLKAVLTEAQFTQYSDGKKEMKQNAKEQYKARKKG